MGMMILGMPDALRPYFLTFVGVVLAFTFTAQWWKHRDEEKDIPLLRRRHKHPLVILVILGLYLFVLWMLFRSAEFGL